MYCYIYILVHKGDIKMLGNRIATLRTARNWTQIQLSQKLNVSKQTVSNWENNNVLPSIELLIKLSLLFSVSTDYLLALDNRKYIEISKLTETQAAHIQQIIDDLNNV